MLRELPLEDILARIVLVFTVGGDKEMRRCLAVALALVMTVAGDAKAQSAVASVTISSSPLTGTTYELGETIEVTVGFTGVVQVRNNFQPGVTLGIGSATRTAKYASGHETSSLVFRYTVQAADSDTDGISIAATALAGNIYRSGSLIMNQGLGSNAITNSSGHKVNGMAVTAPVVSGTAIASSPASGDTYVLGEQIDVTVTFNRLVAVTGTPQLALTIGTATRQANYASRTGTALTFSYTVQGSDGDTDGISVAASALTLNSGTINDPRSGGGAATLGLGTNAISTSSGHKVNGTAASVSLAFPTRGGVSLGRTHELGEQIEMTVIFTHPVTVTGTPQVALGMGTGTRQANYAEGTGTTTLLFRYTVEASDYETNGIFIARDALTLNGGMINDARDGTTAASLGLPVHARGDFRANGRLGPPGVSDVSFSSSPLPASGNTYELAELIEIAVTFNKAVAVTGAPQLALGIGTGTRQASYASRTGTASLTFGYRVQSADEDTDGISVGASALTLNGGTINDADNGVSAVLALGANAITNDALHKVNGGVATAPAVSRVLVASAPGASGAYRPGSAIVVHVAFDRAVEVTGKPRLALTIGAKRRRAAYASGSGTAVLVFRYVVQATTDRDSDGFGVPADALSLNGGTIKIAGGAVDAALDLGALAFGNNPAHKVDGGPREPEPGHAPVFDGKSYAFELAENEAGPVVAGVVSATDADEGDEVFYKLEEGDAGLFEVGEKSGEVVYVGGGEDFEAASERRLVVSASDVGGLKREAEVVVAVVDEKEAPVFEAGPYAFELLENVAGPVVLDTVSAADPDAGDAVSYALASGDAGLFEVRERSGEVVYVGGGEDYEAGPSYSLVVRATDAGGLSAEAPVVVTVAGVNEGPAFEAGPYAFELLENVAGPVVLDTVSAADPDEDDAVSYGLASGGASLFEVDERSGEVRYVGGGEDYEAGPSYSLVVRATDAGGLSAEAPVVVTVAGVNEGPAFEAGPYAFELLENVAGPVVLDTVSAADPDAGDAVSYGLASGGAGLFEVDERSGEVVYVGGGEDYEAGPSYSLVVRATDAGGLSAEAPVVVTVAGVNEGPAFEAGPYAFELLENVAGPVVLDTVSAADPDEDDAVSYGLASGGAGLFEVDERSGEVVYVGGGEDYEAGPSYSLVVRATDAGGLSAEAPVVVTVAGVNEGPAFEAGPYAFELLENVAGPVVLDTVSAADPDAGDAVSYGLASGGAGLFEVDERSGEVRYVGGGEDYEAGPSYSLVVRATDAGGLSAEALVAVTVAGVNEGPAFEAGPYAFELLENVAGPVVLDTVSAADPDEDDAVSYGLASGGAGLFEVDERSGEVRYVGGGEDYEAGPSYSLVVRATDAGGLSAEALVAVTVAGVNEGPAFEAGPYAFELLENVAGPVVLDTVSAADPDEDDAVSYGLASGGAGLFEVDETSGEVRYVGAGEDFEAEPSYSLAVRATDGGELSAEALVAVTVTDENEGPAFEAGSYAFDLAENVAGPVVVGVVSAADPDEGDAVSYELAPGGGALFEVDERSGEVRYVGAGENYEDGPSYSLAVRATDAGGLSAEALVAVTVTDVNEGPEASVPVAPVALEAHGSAAHVDLAAHFWDPDGDAMRYAAESSAPGTAEVVVEGARLTISPKSVGTAVVTATATDPDGLEASQQVQVTVEASRSERERAMKLALASFGRSLGTETVEAVGGRLGVESSGAPGGSHVQLGGRSAGCAAAGESCGLESLARTASGLLGLRLVVPSHEGGPGMSVDGADLLFGGGSAMAGANGGGRFGGGLGAYQGQQEGAALPQTGGFEFGPVSGRDLLSRSSFQLSFGGSPDAGASNAATALGDGAPEATNAQDGDRANPSGSASRWTLWGRANAAGFEGRPGDGFSLEGRTRSAYLGLDYRFAPGFLAGLAASRSALDSDFESAVNGAGALDANLTSLYPYFHWSPRPGLGLWGLVGAGRGRADLTERGTDRFSADLSMRMTAAGVRQALGGSFALKADAFAVRIRSDEAAGLAGVSAAAQRLRLAPELAGRWTVGGSMALHARVEAGGRFDGGDAETGMGAEAGGSIGLSHQATGLTAEARGRALVAHQEDGFRDWGASFSLRLQPGRDEGGPSFSLEPSWGNATGGAGALWREAAAGLEPALASAAAAGRMAVEFGYGVVLPGGGMLTPFGRWSREGAPGHRLNVGIGAERAGARQPAEAAPLRFALRLFGEQVSDGLLPPQRRLNLVGSVSFR